MPRYLFITIFIVATFLFGPVAVATASTASETLSIAYSPFYSPSSVVFEVMKRDRILQQAAERQKVKIQFVLIKKGADGLEAMRRSELNGIVIGDMPLIELANSTPVTVIGKLKQNYSAVIANKGVISQDLKGKRIGNSFATSSHFTLLKTLKNSGLTERDVTLVQMDQNEMPDALLKGKIDAFAGGEPLPSLFLNQYPDRFSSIAKHASSAYLVTTKQLSAKQQDAVFLLASSLARAINWLPKDKQHLQQAVTWNIATMQQLSGKKTSTQADELARLTLSDLQAVNFSAKLPAQLINKKNLLSEEHEFLKSIGRIPKTAQWEQIRSMFNPDLMEKVYRNPAISNINRFDYELK